MVAGLDHGSLLPNKTMIKKSWCFRTLYIGVRFPAVAKNLFVRHRVQTSTVAHPASYPMGTDDYFPGWKAAEA
jgi:hypothetical protein